MHTHHSHSGSFCQHAVDDLEWIIRRAIELKMDLICTTEHMPRLKEAHLYEEEKESGTTPEQLVETFDSFILKARSLHSKYMSEIKVLVGFEAEFIDERSCEFIFSLISKYKPDIWIGSVHFVSEIPIDIDKPTWELAKAKCGGIEGLFTQYFDSQYEIITRLSPPVIGHFDLIRLFSPTNDLTAVWPLVKRNVAEGVRRGCLFEINTAALSKGWDTPYPQRDVAQLIVSEGGKFCLSDDSHSVAQVARNYGAVADYLDSIGSNVIYSIDGAIKSTENLRKWASKNL